MQSKVTRPRAALPRLAPPPCLRPRRRALLGNDTAAFCASLVEGLGELGRAMAAGDGGDGGSVSMRWCAEAMRLVKRMQRELLAHFKNSGRLPPPAPAEAGWFEQYMQETAALLDFCNAFKCAAARLRRYCMVVDAAARTATAVVDVPEAVAARAGEIQGVKAAVQATAERLRGKLIPSAASGGDDRGMAVAVLVAKITMTAVCLLVLSALVPPAAFAAATVGRALGCRVPELRPWCESLSAITSGHGGAPQGIAEHRKVAEVVSALDAKAAAPSGGGGELLSCVELLRRRSLELREGVEVFDAVVDEVFDEVMKGRNEMLRILRDKALT